MQDTLLNNLVTIDEKISPKKPNPSRVKEKEIVLVYFLKHNSSREKHIILLMIPKVEKERWHYFAVKKLSPLLRETKSKHQGDFYCLNCLHSFRTEDEFKSHQKVFKDKDFCEVLMASEKDKVLELNQYMKFDKVQLFTQILKNRWMCKFFNNKNK